METILMINLIVFKQNKVYLELLLVSFTFETHGDRSALPRCGFMKAVLMVLRLEEGAVLSAGPPCGSFIYLNSHTSGRRWWRPLGFPSLRPYVRTANVNLD